jgi:hypothetical protein
VEEREAHLAWERRFARPAAAAAFVSLLAGVIAQVLSVLAASRERSDRAALIRLDEHASEQIAAAVCQSLSIALMLFALYYLLRGVRHRREGGVPLAFDGVLVTAAVLFAFGNIVSAINVIDVAERFVASGARTEARADALIRDQPVVGAVAVLGARLALGIGFVFVNLNAMRVGLLTRFMGIIGIAIGVLYAVPLLPPIVIQIFWLGALVAIFIDRWPGGRGEAWETGEPGVWLSAAELRRQQLRAERTADAPPEMLEQPEPEDIESRPHPVSKKRRRKRGR